MECNFAVYCDSEKASDIKIHTIGCGEHKKREGHDHEWFYAPTYSNAEIIAGLLKKERVLIILTACIVNHHLDNSRP